MEAVFHYVLDQFYAIYQPRQNFDINYGINNQSRIQILPGEIDFFKNSAPFPEQPPIYYSWDNEQIPFWFSAAKTEELIKFTDEKAIIQVDIIAGAFYFLSGWQEYYSPKRDQYGRFPYRESLQKQYGLITLPVVNYYFDILKTAVEKVYNIILSPVLAQDAAFTSCLTHDVDNCRSAWLVEGSEAIRQRNFLKFLKLLRQKITGKDNWFNVPEVMQTVQEYRATSTFFFLANNQKYNGVANADYDITKLPYQNWLTLLQQNNFEVGLHGSNFTATQTSKLSEEIEKIKAPIRGNRFHYLRFDPKQTPQILDDASISYDSTLGFPEHFGFRHGTCYPFRLFNFKTGQAFKFLEIPLHLMDATLHHPNYLQLTNDEILPAIKPMLEEIKKFNGCFTLLWHNENFSPNNTQNGPSAFHRIMRYLQQQNTSFKTTGQVFDLLENHQPE